LEVAADLVELLAGITHRLAGLRKVVEIFGEFEQRELGSCYLVGCGHVGFSDANQMIGWHHHLTRSRSGMAAASSTQGVYG
jgi:hypothetical protein